MKMNRYLPLVAAIALAALLIPQGALAITDQYFVRLKPPVGSDTGAAWDNCGWHTTCASPYADGTGIDWDDEDGDGTCCSTGRNVYFRAWTYRSHPATGTGKTARARIFNYAGASCYEIRAEIRNWVDDKVLATVVYQHASRSAATSSTDLIGNVDGVYTKVSAGAIVTNEKCSAWSGPHTHEKHINGTTSMVKNVGAPPGAIRGADDCSTKPCKWLYQDPGSESAVTSRYVTWSFTT